LLCVRNTCLLRGPLTFPHRKPLPPPCPQIKTICFINSQALSATPFYARSMQLACDILKAFDDLARLRQYRPPLALRYAATLFVHMGPLLLVRSCASPGYLFFSFLQHCSH
jgi:hypothetical protein